MTFRELLSDLEADGRPEAMLRREALLEDFAPNGEAVPPGAVVHAAALVMERERELRQTSSSAAREAVPNTNEYAEHGRSTRSTDASDAHAIDASTR